MTSPLPQLLESMGRTARLKQFTDREWANSAGLRAETLSRLKQRGDCDFATLNQLAAAVDLRFALVPDVPRKMPVRYDREAEEALLSLGASRSTDLSRWLAAGPRYFMAGVAVLLANLRDVDRPAFLMLGDALYPGMSSAPVFQQWLDQSPVKPSRFLPMVEQRMAA